MDPNNPNNPPPGVGYGEDDEVELNEEDVIEVIEVENREGDLADGMDDMDLENYEDEQMEEGAGGIEPPRDDAITVFSLHQGSVFCVNFDPQTSSMAVSGGEDDKAFVWKIESGEMLFECTGHKDSVTCCSFSHDSVYVATGDMSGLIKVWKVETKEEIWSFEVSDLEWLEWHHASHVLLAGTQDGDMWMWKIPGGTTKTFQGHGCPNNNGRIMPDGKRVCAGYEDGVVKFWDLKAGTPLHTITGHGGTNGHTETVTSIDCHHDNNLVMTGSTDLSAKLINSTNGKVLANFYCASPGMDPNDDSVESVGISQTHPLCAAGTLNGALHIWDQSTQVSRHQCKHEAGIVRLKWASDAPVIYTCTLDGAVHMWDARSGKRERQWFGHRAEILSMEISRSHKFLATAAGDGTARIYLVDNSGR